MTWVQKVKIRTGTRSDPGDPVEGILVGCTDNATGETVTGYTDINGTLTLSLTSWIGAFAPSSYTLSAYVGHPYECVSTCSAILEEGQEELVTWFVKLSENGTHIGPKPSLIEGISNIQLFGIVGAVVLLIVIVMLMKR